MTGKYILSYGGGVNTTALMVLLVEKGMALDEAVFADTGGEIPETYENVSFAEKYLSRHDIPLRIVKSKNGTLYDTCKRRKVIPSQIWRWSTRDYKVVPIHSYYRSLKTHIYEYLGIAYDEIHRLKSSKQDYITSIFPLVDQKITRRECINIIMQAGLPVPPKSGCFFCPFNSIERWHQIYVNHRQLYLKSMRLEEQSKHFPRQKLTRLGLRILKSQKFSIPHNSREEHSMCGAYCMT